MTQPTIPSVPPPPPPPVQRKGINLVDRAKNILITPKPEWEIIDREQIPVPGILTAYILPLLLIGAFASFIGFGLIGTNGIKLGAGGGAVRGIIYVLFMAVMVFAVGAAIDVLAPSFGSERNWPKSFRLAAYSFTAAYLGAIWWFFPSLWILVLLCSLYSLYALYVGIAVIKKTAADKQVAYFAIVLLITVVLAIILSLITTEIAKAFQPNPMNQYRRLFGG